MTPPHHLDLTREGFSTRSAEVFAAKEASWYATTPFGIAVLRWREAGLLLRDRRLRQGSHDWPSLMGLQGPFVEFWSHSIIALEGARHKALRALVQETLSQDHIAALDGEFRAIAEGLVERLPGERFEFMEDFATPFAGLAICAVLGLPQEIWRQMAVDASTLGLAMGVEAKQHEAAINAATLRLFDVAKRAVDDPAHPMRVAADGIAQEDLLNAVVIAIFGGVDTTRAQLGLGMALLAGSPEVWQSLREDPELIPGAIEDMIRLRPTTTWATREVVEDFAFEGAQLRRGQKVHILVHAASAQGDWSLSAKERRPAHFGFGGGAHHCLGASVARADMASALAVLTEAFETVRLEAAPEFLPEVGNTGPRSLRLVTRRVV